MQFEPVGLEPQGPDKTRLFLAVTIMMLMWFAYADWLSRNTPQQPTAAAAPSAQTVAAAPELVPVPKPEAAETDAPPSLATPAQDEKITHASARLFEKAMGKKGERVELGYDVSFSNQGAQIVGYELTGYRATPTEDAASSDAQWVDLVHGAMNETHLMALVSRGGDVDLRPTDTFALVASNAQGVTYERTTQEGIKVTRVYESSKTDFTYKHTVTLENVSQTVRELQLSLQLAAQDKGESGGMMNPMVAGHGAACHGADQEHHRVELGDLEEEPLAVKAPLAHVALDDQYFLHALMPNPVDQASCRVSLVEHGEQRGFVLALDYPAFKFGPVKKRCGLKRLLPVPKNWIGCKRWGTVWSRMLILAGSAPSHGPCFGYSSKVTGLPATLDSPSSSSPFWSSFSPFH